MPALAETINFSRTKKDLAYKRGLLAIHWQNDNLCHARYIN